MKKSKFSRSRTPSAGSRAHLGVSELRRLRSLEDENGRRKRLVGDQSLDKHILSGALRKKSEATQCRQLAGWV